MNHDMLSSLLRHIQIGKALPESFVFVKGQLTLMSAHGGPLALNGESIANDKVLLVYYMSPTPLLAWVQLMEQLPCENWADTVQK